MVSTGIKSSELSIKHLAKTFYFVIIFFILKPNQKIYRSLLKVLYFKFIAKTGLTIISVTSFYFLILLNLIKVNVSPNLLSKTNSILPKSSKDIFESEPAIQPLLKSIPSEFILYE